MKYSGDRKLLCELSKFNAFNLLGYLTNTDASIIVYKFRPERTGFNMYTELYTTAIDFSCLTFLLLAVFKSNPLTQGWDYYFIFWFDNRIEQNRIEQNRIEQNRIECFANFQILAFPKIELSKVSSDFCYSIRNIPSELKKNLVQLGLDIDMNEIVRFIVRLRKISVCLRNFAQSQLNLFLC